MSDDPPTYVISSGGFRSAIGDRHREKLSQRSTVVIFVFALFVIFENGILYCIFTKLYGRVRSVTSVFCSSGFVKAVEFVFPVDTEIQWKFGIEHHGLALE